MKTTNPICPFDRKECSPNIHGFMEMDGYLDCTGCNRKNKVAPICPFDGKDCSGYESLSGCAACHDCTRENNGVRETGGMPAMEKIWKFIKSLKP